MGLTLLDKALWIVGLIMQLSLIALLVGKKRFTVFPWFTTFILFGTIETITNFLVYKLAAIATYFWTFTTLSLIDTALQLMVIFEMTRTVLRPTGTWVHDARLMFVSLGLAGAFVAVALSFAVNPEAPSNLLAWTIRLDLFTSLLIAELVVTISFAAQRLGLQWTSWVIGLSQGLMLWISLTLIVETAHSYLGWTRSFVAFDHLRILAYIGALGYWSVVFWRTEPGRRPLSPEMVQYLVSIHKNLDYDLRSISGKK